MDNFRDIANAASDMSDLELLMVIGVSMTVLGVRRGKLWVIQAMNKAVAAFIEHTT